MEKRKSGIQDVIQGIDEWRDSNAQYKELKAGITNSNWLVEVNEKKYFVRIPGNNTELFINRDFAHEASLHAYEAGIGPAVPYFIKETGVEVNEWLEGYNPCNIETMHEKKYFFRSLDLLKKFHESGPLTYTLTIFDDIRRTYNIMKKVGGFEPRETKEMLKLADTIENAINKSGIELKPCDNDPYITNFLWNEKAQDMKLVDYEYSANNDPGYELGIYSGELFLYEDQEREMIEHYYGEFNEQKFARMKLYKIAGDIKWVFWSCIQNTISKLDFEYIKYAYYMMYRMLNFVKAPHFNDWLEKS